MTRLNRTPRNYATAAAIAGLFFLVPFAIGLPVGISLYHSTAAAKDQEPTIGNRERGVKANDFLFEVGNKWVYKTVNPDDQRRTTVRVTDRKMIDGVNCYRLETKSNGQVLQTEYVAVGQDGLYRHAVDGLLVDDVKYDPPWHFFKSSAKVGDSWKADSKTSYGSLSTTFEVTAIDKEIQTAAGMFRTTVVEMTAVVDSALLDLDEVSVSTTAYYAAEVGMVRSEVYLAEEPVVIEMESFVRADKRNRLSAEKTTAKR